MKRACWGLLSRTRGITISSHLSKVEPLAYFGAKDIPEIIIEATGGPFLMGCLKRGRHLGHGSLMLGGVLSTIRILAHVWCDIEKVVKVTF